MSYHQDWLIRQIESITIMLRWMLNGEREPTLKISEAEPSAGSCSELELQVQTLLRERQICQAEDMLYTALETPNREVLETAIHFYDSLSRFSDEALKNANFSREEIYEGLQHVCHVFGLPSGA